MARRSEDDSEVLAEVGMTSGFDFTEQSIRKNFIKKVYSILMCQLLITLSFITLFVFCGPVKEYTTGESGLRLLLAAVLAVIVCLIAMLCFEGARRKAPTNYIFLGIFTVAESFLLGVTSSRYNPQVVMIAVGMTAAVCLALTLFAFQTKCDFTMLGGILLCTTVVLLLFGIIAIFIHDRILDLVYSALGAILFSFYLIYDTQLMMGGKHKYTISPEEYIFAALNLYLDIITLFIIIFISYILRIFTLRCCRATVVVCAQSD